MNHNPKSVNSINDHCVRLSVNGEPVGSGFVILCKENQFAYILTARHCFKDSDPTNRISIEWYDYEKQIFNGQTISFSEYPLLSFSDADSYDGAILVIPREMLLKLISSVLLSETIEPNQLFSFRGFPDVRSNEEPEEIDVKSLFIAGHQIRLKVMDDVEDNRSTAYANVKGFSGSGLYQIVNEHIYLVGIITDFKAGIKRFVACDLVRLNELLKGQGFQEMHFHVIPENKNNSHSYDPSDFLNQCKKLLDNAESYWKELLPKQSLAMVRTVRKNVEDSTLPVEIRNPLLARVHYLEALTAGDLRESVDINNLFITANALVPNTLLYQERAAGAYLVKGEKNKAYELAEKILSIYEYNPRAWLIINQVEETKDVPKSVQDDPIFRVGYILFSGLKSSDGTLSISEYKNLFQKEIGERTIPTALNRENIYFWSYVAQFALHDLMGQLNRIHTLHRPKELVGNSQLKYARDLFALIGKRIESSDLQNEKFFQVLRYEYYYCCYFLSEDPANVKQLANQLGELFISSSKGSDTLFNPNRSTAIHAIPHRIIDLLIILSHQNEGQRILDVIQAARAFRNDSLLHLFEGTAHGILKDKERQSQSLKAYLELTESIDTHEAINFLDPIQILFGAKEPLEVIWKIAIEGKTFQQSYLQPFLESFLWSLSQETKDLALNRAEDVRKQWLDLPDLLQKMLVRIYMQLSEWTIAKDLLRDLCDETKESEELCLYLIAVYNERKNIQLFLNLAGHWRSTFTPNSELIWYELCIHRQLHNYPMLEIVASYGIKHFPTSILYWWDLVRGLHCQGESKKFELLEQLAQDQYVFSEEMTTEGRFSLAHICFLADLPEKGMEVAYRALMSNQANPAVRQRYFHLSNQYKGIDDMAWPEMASQDMIVLLRSGENEQLLELSSEAIEYNPIAKEIIGRRAGEFITHFVRLTGRNETYFIDRIYDKYRGQLALILKKFDAEPFSGSEMVSLKVDSGNFDIEKFQKQLQELLGAEGTRRKIIVEGIRKQFATSQIGFAELCQGAFGGDPVAAWYYAISDNAGGFPICPINIQTKPNISPETEFVLDFTSLLPLFFLSKVEKLPIEGKLFIISQFTFDYISRELQNAIHERESTISAEILIDRTIPYFHPEDQHEKKIALYKDILNWVKDFCKIDYALERLTNEFDQQLDDDLLFSEDNIFKSSLTDSILLANRPGRFLVTDEQLVYRNLSSAIRLFSTEHYLKLLHTKLYNQSLWLSLVQYNYRGLTLTVNQLHKAFKNSIIGGSKIPNDYSKATFSFSKQYNSNPNLLFVVLNFLKRLYADDFSLDYKQQTSRALFRRFFQNSQPVSERFVLLFHQKIDQEFKLLGNYGDNVKTDFNIALGLM